MESESFKKALNGLLSKKNLMRAGALSLFAALALGSAAFFLSSVNGNNLVADFSSIFGRAVSGIFNGAAAEKFIGAANISENRTDSDDIPAFRGKSAAKDQKEPSAAVPAASAEAKININVAGLIELEKISGIGPVTAQKIIDHRTANGIFYKIEDIQNVSGIGPATFEKMKLEITVGDVPPAPAPPAPSAPADGPPVPPQNIPSAEPEEFETEARQAVKININTASASGLEKISGVGPTIAQKIVDYRRSHGLFYRIEDIKKVSGIGEATFNKMKGEITVGNVTPPEEPEEEVADKPEEELVEQEPAEPEQDITAGEDESDALAEGQAAEPGAQESSSESDAQQEGLIPSNEDEAPVEEGPLADEPPAEETGQTVESPVAEYTNVLISEIMAGIAGNSDYEFIELYNPTNSEMDLTGLHIKKKSSTGTESSLVVASRFEGKTIPAGEYLLIAKDDGYNGEVSPDIGWPKSYTLAYTNNSIVLYGPSGQIEEVSWANIPIGSSYERGSWDSSVFHVQSAPSPANLSGN